MITKNKVVALLIVVNLTSFAQQLFYPLDHDDNAFVEMYLNNTKSNSHTSVKPYFYQDIQKAINTDSIDSMLTDTNRLYLLPTSYWAKFLRWSENKLMDEDLVYINGDGLKLRANLLLGLQTGRDAYQEDYFWTNTRGYWLSGQIGKKVFFESAFYENQAKLLPYINSNVTSNLVMPGQGRYKIFKENIGADWAFASGAVGYKANKYFKVFMGHGKNFFGDGYRSMLLSDNTFNYPYFKFETTVWNIKYVNLWAQLNHIGFQDAGDRNWTQKYLALHYLSWNITKKLNVSLYESISWLKADKGFDWQYINPVIFMRPVEWQNGSADNVLLGASAKFKINDDFTIYGQAVLDDLNFSELKKGNGYWGNKYGGQIGVKAYNLLGVYGLSAQAEYNVARPFTYSHFDSTNAHVHMNEPLAHPLGANFQEAIGFIRYKYKRHKFTFKMVWSEIGKDTSGVNHGGNIFYSYNTNRIDVNGDGGLSGYTIGQGDLNRLNFFDLRYAFLINPRARLYFEMGIKDRVLSRQTLPNDKTRFLYLGLRTTLNNFYYDSF
tara:strand:- start:25677 stop:27323 length:1647 start_codon:yes stop_codon:yes gene_type:complete